MRKVIPLHTKGDVQELLCEAADMGFSQVVIVGKNQDGTYWLAKTPIESTTEVVGIMEMTKQWLLEGMG